MNIFILFEILDYLEHVIAKSDLFLPHFIFVKLYYFENSNQYIVLLERLSNTDVLMVLFIITIQENAHKSSNNILVDKHCICRNYLGCFDFIAASILSI